MRRLLIGLAVLSVASCVTCGGGLAAYSLFRPRPAPAPAIATGPVEVGNAADLRYGIEQWQIAHGLAACPTLDDLSREGLLMPSSRVDDFGGAWVLTCAGGAVTATGPGPDHVAGTPDDVIVRVGT